MNVKIEKNNFSGEYAVLIKEDGEPFYELHTPSLTHENAIALRHQLLSEHNQKGIPSDAWELL